jgi:hypothetical protein
MILGSGQEIRGRGPLAGVSRTGLGYGLKGVVRTPVAARASPPSPHRPGSARSGPSATHPLASHVRWLPTRCGATSCSADTRPRLGSRRPASRGQWCSDGMVSGRRSSSDNYTRIANSPAPPRLPAQRWAEAPEVQADDLGCCGVSMPPPGKRSAPARGSAVTRHERAPHFRLDQERCRGSRVPQEGWHSTIPTPAAANVPPHL